MSLYLWLNILTFSIPFFLSFDKRVHFYTRWKFFFPAMALTMIIFLVWDAIFTHYGVWRFNDQYISGWRLLGLPLEEYLFFITVPYASVFTIYVFDHYFPNIRIRDSLVRLITLFLIAALLFIAVFYRDRAYTLVNFVFAAIVLALVYFTSPRLLRQFYLSYLVILVPFILVNGILTGSFIEDQVVWYNDFENLGIRLGTIPIEDIFYGMSLILLSYYLTEILHSLSKRHSKP